MRFTKVLSRLFTSSTIALFICMFTLSANALEEEETPHYPISQPKQMQWSFSGPFGHWDTGQLQRGLQIYTEVCSACHSMNLVPFRALKNLGYSEEQVKTFAAEYEVTDGPDRDGEMFERSARPSDYFSDPYANSVEAANANNGAIPPDFSLLAKARAPGRGFPTFILDIFSMYAENGPDYIYSLLTGYQDPPDGLKVSEGTYYNPYFISGESLSMSPPLEEGLVEYEDNSPQTVSQYAQDITAFMMWAAEPKLMEQKAMGFKVMLFLIVFVTLLYFTKKKIFANLKGPG